MHKMKTGKRGKVQIFKLIVIMGYTVKKSGVGIGKRNPVGLVWGPP